MKYILLIAFLISCVQSHSETKNAEVRTPPTEIPEEQMLSLINPAGEHLKTRFIVPNGYERVQEQPASFGSWLRQLPLKPHGSRVTYFDGGIKLTTSVYDAVVDLPIGKRDLHQCADAVMRLRADYLRARERYDDISFKFTNGFDAGYQKWKDGYRIRVNGNDVQWVQTASPSLDDATYWKYLEMVFAYAGTASLSKEIHPVPISEMQIGDVLIQGGFPGHAVIVVDMASNAAGEKIYLLAQSYMPAQEIQILKNPNNPGMSPWYQLSDDSSISTPEWNFQSEDLKRF